MSDAFAPMRIVDLSQHQSQRFSSVTSLVKQQQQQSDTSHSRRNGTPHHHHHPLRQHYNSPVLPRMRLHQSATPGTPEKNVELPASVVLATTTTTLPVVSNTDTGSSSSIPLSGSVLSISSGAPSEKSLSNNSNIKTNSSNSSNNPPFLVTLDDATRSTYEQAIQRTLLWVGSAIVFGGGLWFAVGPQTGQEFFAGYLVEQSLSVDNLFVFLMLFEYFKVPLTYQDRVLNWGIYGAIVMRAIMIGLGAAALEQFHAILLVFAGILVYSSAQFFLNNNNEEEEEDVSQNSIVQFSRNLIPSTEEYDGDRFFTLVDGIRTATPLFICMIAVEVSDVVFAVDSVPAVFGVTEVRSTAWFLSLEAAHLACR